MNTVQKYIDKIDNTRFSSIISFPLEEADEDRSWHKYHYNMARDYIGKEAENPQSAIDSIKNQIAELKELIAPYNDEYEQALTVYNKAKSKLRADESRRDSLKKSRRVENLELELKVPIKKLETYESQLYRSREMKLSDTVIKSIEDNISRIKNEWGDKINELHDSRYFLSNSWNIIQEDELKVKEANKILSAAADALDALDEYHQIHQLEEELKAKEKARAEAVKDANIFANFGDSSEWNKKDSSVVFHCKHVWYWIKYHNHAKANNAKLMPLWKSYQWAAENARKHAERAKFLETFAETDAEIAEFCKLIDGLDSDISYLNSCLKEFEELYHSIVQNP